MTIALVTGASGYLGSWVTYTLLTQTDFNVRGTVRSVSGKKVEHLLKLQKEFPGRLELVELNLLTEDDEVFKKAMVGCTFVLHTASPFPLITPKDENELIKPAVEGTLRVLRAVDATETVTRVVVTSSTAAVCAGWKYDANKVFNESDWSIVEKVQAYAKSKILAEQSVWKFKKSSDRYSISVCNPCFILGPSLNQDVGTSVDVIKKFLMRELPIVPNLIQHMVDVRDVALCHVRILQASDKQKIDGKRFICVSNEVYSFPFVAATLAKEFSPYGYNVPTFSPPKFLLFIPSFFNPLLGQLYSSIDNYHKIDNSASKNVLGLQYRDMEKTIIDSGYSLIYQGIVPVKNNVPLKPPTL